MEPASASRSARLLLGLKQLPAACSSFQLRHIQTRRIRGSGIPRISCFSPACCRKTYCSTRQPWSRSKWWARLPLPAVSLRVRTDWLKTRRIRLASHQPPCVRHLISTRAHWQFNCFFQCQMCIVIQKLPLFSCCRTFQRFQQTLITAKIISPEDLFWFWYSENLNSNTPTGSKTEEAVSHQHLLNFFLHFSLMGWSL